MVCNKISPLSGQGKLPFDNICDLWNLLWLNLLDLPDLYRDECKKNFQFYNNSPMHNGGWMNFQDNYSQWQFAATHRCYTSVQREGLWGLPALLQNTTLWSDRSSNQFKNWGCPLKSDKSHQLQLQSNWTISLLAAVEQCMWLVEDLLSY